MEVNYRPLWVDNLSLQIIFDVSLVIFLPSFLQSDIRDYSSLYKVCEGVDCIFHTASYGMSGPEQVTSLHIVFIIIKGHLTHCFLSVCKERSIPRLVYTSTINVVFAGKPIEEGDEVSVPYVPPDHIDHYSRTKAIAEQMVLSANGCSLTGVKRSVCALTSSSQHDMKRVNVERRLFSFRFGDPRARMNWVHVNNLVLAHTLAAEALTLQRSCVASGQAYFINDGVSVNLFEWLTPLELPDMIPVLIKHFIAVSHTFKIDKARQELGYCPKPYSLTDSVEQYLKSRQPRSSLALFSLSWTSQQPQHLLLLLLMGLSLLLLMLSCIFCQN
uniref:Short chain dehydrogenase/reductase family 42E, member 2 n=1 Tax=Sander lucioperca TaxID=283035 RepID=A0A8D0CVZ7_SANLU